MDAVLAQEVTFETGGGPGAAFWIVWIAIWVVSIDLARSFGKGTGFGVGLAFLSIIFAPILAWGDATYQGPSVPGAAMPPVAPPPPPAPPAMA